jgi:hypothetical protein
LIAKKKIGGTSLHIFLFLFYKTQQKTRPTPGGDWLRSFKMKHDPLKGSRTPSFEKESIKIPPQSKNGNLRHFRAFFLTSKSPQNMPS